MERRSLIIHAGGGKAGSSALQSALSRAAGDLAKVGLTYEDSRPLLSAYEITSGNGFRLFEEVGDPDWPAKGSTTIELLLGDNPIGICSSEFLGSLTPMRWRSIIEIAEQVAVDVKVVYFVRSAVGYVVSSYYQNVKRSGEYRPLEDAAPEISWQHIDDLRTLEAVLSKEQLAVINYDRVRDDIGAAFTSAFPELAPARTLLDGASNLRVNRSLTGCELEVMRRVNRKFGGRYSHELSDRFIYDAPELEARLCVPEGVANLIAGKFAEATTWINNTFLNDQGKPLTIEAGSMSADDDPDQLERPLSIALAWALETLGNDSMDRSFIRDRLLAIDWENASDPAIPADFDPIAYLIINLDVLEAQLPPYSHFIKSGREEGRDYRWPRIQNSSVDAPTAEAIAQARLESSAQPGDIEPSHRLRHLLQLESLLHEFADRERDYLKVIRNLRETRGYETEQFRQVTGKLLEPLSADLTHVAQAAENINSQLGALIREQSELNSLVNRKEAELEKKNAEVQELSVELQEKTSELERFQRMSFFEFLRYKM